MNRLRMLYDVTVQLKELLDQEITAKNRQDVIEQIDQLVEKRGILLKEITPPFTDEEKEMGKELVSINKWIQNKMEHLFHELKLEMKQMQRQKKSNQSYVNPYKHVQSMDGMFLDSKN